MELNLSLANLLPQFKVASLIDQWLEEDSTAFDVGGYVAGGNRVKSANLFCKQPNQIILAGQLFFDTLFQRLDCNVEWLPNCKDGSPLPNLNQLKRHIAIVRGPVANILRGERVALNCLSRASGVATGVKEIGDLARKNGWKGRIACTRKTTPGFRLVEKYAVMCGGGDPHRYDLGGSMIMLKDNHIDACNGEIAKAVTTAKTIASFATKIDVETRNLREALEAAKNGADVVMLDNFSAKDAKSAAAQVKKTYPQVIIEASGGVNTINVSDYFDDNIDVISMGCLTQGYKCIDFSLKIVRGG